jgi:MoaA/NifB/PqqE/SkfB family radical SAM enzyme
MSFAETVRDIWRKDILFSVLVELTYRCNLDCFFCYNDLGLRGRPLTTGQYLRFFEDLRDMQVLNLVLTGGEPLAHPDFLRLGRHARELGFVIRIKSNGHALRGALARRIKEEIDPFVVELSLHGARAETHDRQTRVPGSFERLTANIPELLALGLRVRLNSTLTSWNEGEIEEMLALASSLGVHLNIGPEVTPRDDGDRSPLAISASPEGLRRLFELRHTGARQPGAAAGDDQAAPVVARQFDEDLPVARDKHCGAGSSGIAVDPYGNVYPCVQWRRAVGSLHEKSIKEIWAVSPALVDVRRLTAEAKTLVSGLGEHGKLMSFCPGAALANAGSPVKLYPAAVKRMEIRAAVEKGGA